MTKQLYPSNEILSAILSGGLQGQDATELVKDPKSYLENSIGVDVAGKSVNVQENTEDTINLTLPYYSGLEETTARMVAEGELEETAGGEIVVIAILTGLGITVAAPMLAVGAYEVDKYVKSKNKAKK